MERLMIYTSDHPDSGSDSRMLSENKYPPVDGGTVSKFIKGKILQNPYVFL